VCEVWRRSAVKWESLSTNNNKNKQKNNVRDHWGPFPGPKIMLNFEHFWKWTPNVQYTPPTPTRRNCRVASCRRCEHTRRQSWPSLQFLVLTTDKWQHNNVIVEKNCKSSRILHYTADSNVYKRAASYVTSYPTSIALAAEFVNLVTAIGCVHIAESVGSRRELVANSCTYRRRRRDATKQFRRVGCVYWA